MKTARWYFDFISPYSYLQHTVLTRFEGLVQIEPVPILFAGLLEHHGQKGPAEIPAKKVQTFREIVWLAHQHQIPLGLPQAHPFNPLALLRLLCARELSVADAAAAFSLVWGEGRDPQSPETAAALACALGVSPDAGNDPAVKDRLRSNTEAAVAAGVYGVPTLAIGHELFWGLDAMPMARAYLADPSLFASGEMARVSNLPMAVERPR
jgi:2-hydroxychromene-2-carboxylate isomerase